MTRALALLMLLVAAGPAWGQVHAPPQDDAVRGFYASIANNIRAEYDSMLEMIARGMTGGPGAQSAAARDMLKMLYYNRAAQFSYCAAEAAQGRPPNAARILAGQNLLLTTCVEQKFAEINKFNNVFGYVRTFFPDRVAPCGERARLHEREKLLPPYEFLHLDEPKLYDFALYNDCLMTKQ